LAGLFGPGSGAIRLFTRPFLEDVGNLGVARRADDMNKVAGVDRPIMDDRGLFEAIKGLAQLLPEAAAASRLCCRTACGSSPRPWQNSAHGFRAKVAASGQVFLAEHLAGLPVVQGVAARREQCHEAGIETVRPNAACVRAHGYLAAHRRPGGRYIRDSVGADSDGARHETIHVRPELVVLALAGAAAKSAQDGVRGHDDGMPERAARRELDELHEIVVVVLIELLTGKGDFNAFLTGDHFLVHLPAVFAPDRGEQGAPGDDVRNGRRVFREG